jgi:LacI family transcriptional regulator
MPRSAAKRHPNGEKKQSAMRRRIRVPHVLLLIDTAGGCGRGMIQGISRYALENGPWSIQLAMLRALDSPPPPWLKDWRGDGIICRTVNKKLMKMLWTGKLPVVELHGRPEIGLIQVQFDILEVARMTLDHFLNCGLAHFGYFSFGESWAVKINREPFCDLLKERGYDCHCYQPPASNRVAPAWRESQRPGLIRWLRSLPRPMGIFTPGDLHSMLLLDLCREIGIHVPEEIAILGLGNDVLICETVRPTLSSVDIDVRRVGYEAAALLDRLMAGKKEKDIICVPPSHIAIRQSTDVIAVEDADVAEALRFIRQFACKGIEVSDVVEEVGLSRRTLELRFGRYLGRSPKAEISRVQIEHAKTLLTRTDQTSESIARRSGFSSLEYFTTAFHRIVGMKPQAYRKLRRISCDFGADAEN